MRRALGVASVALALTMLAYRLVGLGDAPFIRDEAFFLEAARQQLATGDWVSGSPIVGGQGIPYGPSVLWFYGVVQRLLGPSPIACIAAMCALVSVAHLSLAVALTRAFRRGPCFFATILALIASSPYQFFWARLAWDQLVDALSALAIVLLCAPTISPRRGLALGVVLGLALSSHLMVAPLVLVIGVVLLVEHLRRPRALLALGGATLATALLVNVPYLLFLSRATIRPGSPIDEVHALGLRALQPARAASLWGIEYFFDADWPRYLGSLGLSRAWPALATTALAVVTLLALLGLGVMIVRGDRAVRRVGALAATTWLVYTAFYAAKMLPLEPHYQFPTWWVIPVGVAGSLALTGERPSRILSALVWLLALAQLAFLASATRFLARESGTRGVHHGPPVAHQRELVRAACGRTVPGQAVQIVNLTSTFRGSLEYLARIDPACADRSVSVCRKHCPSATERTLHLRLGYAAGSGGALTLTDAPKPDARGDATTF